MSEKLNELKEKLGEVSDLGSAAALLGWDQQVNMPTGGAEARGRHMATLGKVIQEKFTSDAAVLAVAAVAFAVMCAGVVLLTQTAPPTMKADIHTDKGGDGQQAAVIGVQDAGHDLPPEHAARDRRRPGSGRLPPRRDERDGHGP